MTGVATLGRWLVGGLSDRYGTGPFIWSLLAVAALALAGIAYGLWQRDAIALIGGAALLGLAYGALQTVTLVRCYADAGEENRPSASVVWNVGFDVGTGLGAALIGAMAGGYGFAQAFITTAVLLLAAALVVLVRDRAGFRRKP